MDVSRRGDLHAREHARYEDEGAWGVEVLEQPDGLGGRCELKTNVSGSGGALQGL